MNYNLIFQLTLLVLVFISKEFIVFNEEILVLVAFFIFISLIINFAKSSINDSLNSKLEEIKNEFDFYKNLQKQTISYLINFHKKQALLAKNVQKILSFSIEQLKFVESCFDIFWYNRIKINFEDKLKKLINCESQKNTFIQNFYLINLSYFFNEKYNFLSKSNQISKKIRKTIVLKSLDRLKSL